MIFLLSSFVPPSADVMWGPSIRVYAPLVHLRPRIGELVTINTVDASVVLIRSLDLVVIWSSLEDHSVRFAA
jgi:hypothetical protein